MQHPHRVSRAVHFPQSFPDSTFSHTGLLIFAPSDRESKDAEYYAMSVVCRCIMRSDDDVHAYGERIATKQNDGYLARHGKPAPESAKRTYLGFYDAPYQSLEEVFLEFYNLTIVWVPEDGETAHLEIRFVRNPSASHGDRKRRRADRTAAIDAMAERLHGPFFAPQLKENPSISERQRELPALNVIPEATDAPAGP